MNAAGHDSVQMHKRYVRLRQEDIASAFGTSLEMATEIVTEEKAVSAKWLIWFVEKEGARWCRWSSKLVTRFFDRSMKTGG